jgi:ribonuclease P/MRP protein subunit RPP40
MAEYFPEHLSCQPKISPAISVMVPNLQPASAATTKDDGRFSDLSTELYEWLSLISLESPRIQTGDTIDPFLSRYSLPSSGDGISVPVEVIKVTWEGFISAVWAHKLLVKALIAAAPKNWTSFSVVGFPDSISESHDCTILKLPGSSNEFILWEIEQS